MPGPSDILRTIGVGVKKASGINYEAEALREELTKLTIAQLKERAKAAGLSPKAGWGKGDYINRIIMSSKETP